ncbi:MAG: PLP-dependent aminotransferase family protein [Acidobacteriota bacterium]|nr:PLP-dependent aminotransferase family protein [Acidobacteriota bacterium]
MKIQLKDCFYQETLNAMNFLNEIVMRYPKAVSFAPGRPVEELFNVHGHLREVSLFASWYGQRTRRTTNDALNSLGNYGRTNGVLGDLLAQHLKVDENIEADPEAVMVTSGCQEGMAIAMSGLFDPAHDVLLISDPTYIGITGLAGILGIEMEPLPFDEEGFDPQVLRTAAAKVKARGKNPRAAYLIPDYNNPLGTSMPLETRRRVLEIAAELDLLLLEDNPYGMFSFDEQPMPTLKSMDREKRVIYMGTFSKTLFPGLRLGYMVADQETADGHLLADELSKVKSFISVNTSGILQAVVGGVLLRTGGSLRKEIEPKLAFYKKNRDTMLAELEKQLGQDVLNGAVHWNRPAGGYFLTVTLPFDLTPERLDICAGEYGVIVCPMSLFSLAGGHERQIRLSFSYVHPEDIVEGITRLARFIHAQVQEDGFGMSPT